MWANPICDSHYHFEICTVFYKMCLPCVRSWRVLTSSLTRSCRTCCRMCCLWPSCMIPILSSFLSVNLIRARPKQKTKTSLKVKGQKEQEASGNPICTAGETKRVQHSICVSQRTEWGNLQVKKYVQEITATQFMRCILITEHKMLKLCKVATMFLT